MDYREARKLLETELFWDIIPDGVCISELIPSLYEGEVCDSFFTYGKASGGTVQGPFRCIKFDASKNAVLEVMRCKALQNLKPESSAQADRKEALAQYEQLYPGVRRLFEQRAENTATEQDKQRLASFLWALYHIDSVVYPWYAMASVDFFAWVSACANGTEGR